MPGIVSKPARGSSGASLIAAAIVKDMSTDGFDPATQGSEVVVHAAKAGSVGTAVYKVLEAARPMLRDAGVKTPKGLTLRSAKTAEVDAEGGGIDVTVTYYFGDPTDKTDPKYIGK